MLLGHSASSYHMALAQSNEPLGLTATPTQRLVLGILRTPGGRY